MVLSIKHPEADKMARELAQLTGLSMTQAIMEALRQQISALKSRKAQNDANDISEIMAIIDHCSSLPTLNNLSADEILGYNEFGLPS